MSRTKSVRFFSYLFFGFFLWASGAIAAEPLLVTGRKFPNSPAEGKSPVEVTVSLPRAVKSVAGRNKRLPGFSELVPFVLLAPDQEEAGSCLYMSLTGIAEWYLAKQNPKLSRAPEGPLDLSERYLMNIAGLEEDENGMENWKTDSIYLFNNHRSESILNRDYPFAKGWYRRDEQGEIVPSQRGETGAAYDASYSWIDERHKAEGAPRVRLPKFSREVIFADPEDNQWNTGIIPSGVVEKVKQALRSGKPVHVIYNHFGYWHANIVLGYDDAFDNQSCKFVRDFTSFMRREEQNKRDQAAVETDPDEKKALLDRADKFARAYRGTEEHWARLGGCRTKGAFYVRDSIYSDPSEPVYGYATETKDDDAPYSKRIVMLEYDWLLTMSNHVTVISAE